MTPIVATCCDPVVPERRRRRRLLPRHRGGIRKKEDLRQRKLQRRKILDNVELESRSQTLQRTRAKMNNKMYVSVWEAMRDKA